MKADAVQNFLQGFWFGLPSLLLAVSGFPPLWGAVFRKYVDVDELKGAHFVVELPSPGSNRRLLDDIDDVSLLQGSTQLSHDDDEDDDDTKKKKKTRHETLKDCIANNAGHLQF